MPTLLQKITCRLNVNKPLSKSTLDYHNKVIYKKNYKKGYKQIFRHGNQGEISI